MRAGQADLLFGLCGISSSNRAIGMHWIRRNRNFGSWAALFALTLQLVLAFGHIHAEDILAAPASVAAQHQAQPGTPANDDGPADRHHDLCAICVAFHLTSSSVVPVVETLAIPIAHSHTWDADVARERTGDDLRFPFQARGPPSI